MVQVQTTAQDVCVCVPLYLESSRALVGKHVGSITWHLAVDSPAKELIYQHDNLYP